MKRRAAVIATTIALVIGGTATNAAANSSYCGHSVSYGWTGVTHYVYSYTADGQHKHVMSWIRYMSGTPTYRVCSP